MSRITLPPDPKLASKIIDVEAAAEAHRRERGLVGFIVGTGTEKPGNIAAIVILFAIFGIAVVLIWFTDTTSLTRKDIISAFISVITLALGYIFGRGGISPNSKP